MYAREMERYAYDYDYEKEPDDIEEFEYSYLDESDDRLYVVMGEIRSYCVRKGNYSPVASDPEEYYGEYRTEHEIIDAYYLTFSEDCVEIEIDELPAWVVDQVAIDAGE